MAQTLQTLSIISFVVAGVCLAIAVFFWFFFKIPIVISDLSGRTARNSIAKMRAANEKTGAKSYKGSKTNTVRGKLTGTIPDSGELEEKRDVSVDEKPETGLLSDNMAEVFDLEATSILGSETTGLLVDENATVLLDTPAHKHPARTGGKKIEMIEEVVLIHTDEVI